MTPANPEEPARRTGRPTGRAGRTNYRGAGQSMMAIGVLGIGVALLLLWLHDGEITSIHSAAGLLMSLGRITGLFGAFLLLLQVLMLARIRPLERLFGYDRLTLWHGVNGKLCLYLIVAHVALITAGYALTDRVAITSEVSTLLTQYPGMVDALIGTGLLIAVVITSLTMARRRLRYEIWYLIHLAAYAAVVLAWFHQLPTGNEFVLNPSAAALWTALYLLTLLLVLLFRVALPVLFAFRYQLKVAEVTAEGPNVVSLRLTGRHLDRLGARAGQFFLWRFLTPRLAWESHPFSLSAAPDHQSLRITVKSLGDFSSRMGQIRPGTRVLGVGPFGLFTDAERHRDRVALIAGGVGITPIRALLEEMSGDVVVIYRVTQEADVVFRDELEDLARERGIRVFYVTGSHRDPGGEHLLSEDHLREMVPDIGSREVYICGPSTMADLVERNVRAVGVPRKYIHSERFAFAPEPAGTTRSALTPTATRLSILGVFLAATAAVAARFAWAATHSATPVVAAIPTVKPTAIAAAQPANAVATQTPIARRTPAATKPTAQPRLATRYAGPTISTQYGPIQVTITVRSSRIAAVTVAATPDSARSAITEQQAIPVLKSETLQAQSAQISTLSGATAWSDGYRQSLQGALTNAHL